MAHKPTLCRARGGAALLLIAAVTTLTLSCVQPYAATEGVAVYVVADHFHAEVLIQEPVPGGFYYTLYTFVDRSWYLGRTIDLWNGARAILTNTDAAVGVGRATSSRSASEVLEGFGIGTELNGWRFLIPPDRVATAREHVEQVVIGTGAAVLEVQQRGAFETTYYEAARPYHLFYSCNQFAADVMNVAGVNFEPVWYHYTVSILRDRHNQLVPMAF